MAKKTVTPREQERRFLLPELFFSTTDRKGVITFGNEVFTRISGYPEAELVGAPHNIIRHPDMPRAVFRLLWDYLLSGRSIVAYVKNMAADGSFYWVVALVAPIQEGFLSIRLKPSAGLLPTVENLYREMRQIEAAIEEQGKPREQAMEASTRRMLQALASLGFDSYDAFMDHLLVTEVTARKAGTHAAPAASATPPSASSHHATPDSAATADSAAADVDTMAAHCAAIAAEVSALFARLGSFLALRKALAEKTGFIASLGRSLELQSLNAQVRAAGLEHEGRTLQVIAEQMSASARGTSQSALDICSTIDHVGKVLGDAAFRIATSDLNVEMMSLFLRELAASAGTTAATSATAARHRVGQLAEVIAANLDATCQCVAAASAQVRKLEQRLEAFLKDVRTLEILHVTGRVEAVRCREGQNVSAIFEEVYAQTQKAREELTALTEMIAGARISPPRREQLEERLVGLRA